MPMKVISGLAAGVLLLGLYYLESSESDYSLPTEYTEGPEALDWLKKNDGESALASNRFGETRNAVKFVQQLYNAGAQKVIVPMAAIQSDDIETYADALVVTLPTDPAMRERVWSLCADELKREGEDPGKTFTGEHVLLWWD